MEPVDASGAARRGGRVVVQFCSVVARGARAYFYLYSVKPIQCRYVHSVDPDVFICVHTLLHWLFEARRPGADTCVGGLITNTLNATAYLLRVLRRQFHLCGSACMWLHH